MTDVYLEANAIDLKEEAGRRRGSEFVAGEPDNEQVASQLAQEAACMSNTKGGGALIVGVDGKPGDLIGADTDPTGSGTESADSWAARSSRPFASLKYQRSAFTSSDGSGTY